MALDDVKKEATQELKPGDFICDDCKRTSYAPHEGMFLDPEDEEAVRCIDCDLRHRGII